MENICETQQSVLTEDNKVIKLLHTSQGSRECKNRWKRSWNVKDMAKQSSKDLFAIDLNFQGLALKKPGTKTKLNLTREG